MNDSELFELWVYLSESPLLHLTLTLLAYQVARSLHRLSGGHPLANPVAIAVGLLIALLLMTDTDYATYFEGAQFVHFLLGPATVALAIPLYGQLSKLRAIWLPVMGAVTVGVCTAALSAIAIAKLLGGSVISQLSLAPKSATAPVAMGVSDAIGGLPSLTAVLVVTTGIIGAVTGGWICDRLGIRDTSVRGIAIGVASHGIGTARAFQISPEMGAFAGLGMALSAGMTALLVPLLVKLLGIVA